MKIQNDRAKIIGRNKFKAGALSALTILFIVCLTLAMALMPATEPITTYAEATFNNILNTNIGLHPKWIETTCISAKEGGVGDTYTNKHNVWHADVTKANDDGVGNDVIMEKSSSYKFLGTEEHAEDLIREYSLKKDNEVVFNIEDSDSAAKVWADAVAFAQSLGTPTPLADESLAGTANKSACEGGSNENHYGFRVGTNMGVRNMYQGNFFINNDGGALGQYIIVRLQADWTAKAITTTAPTGIVGQNEHNSNTAHSTNSDYLTGVTGEGTSVSTTSFNYVSNVGNNTPNVFGTSATYLPTATSQDGFTRIDSNDNGYVISWDLASNSCDYDGAVSSDDGFTSKTGGKSQYYGYVYNDNCAFSYGRINVPTGVYIVLDLNGHKIDRALASGGNYYGSVFHIDSKARLEIMDSTAYENASAARIVGTDDAGHNANGTAHTTNHEGTITGGNVLKSNSLGLPLTLQANLQSSGGGFNLSMWADLVIHSGTISNNKNSESGGAFYQRSKAAVTIFDGYVLDNEAGNGGVTNLGSGSGCPFTMYGGVLAYNKAKNGGAVNLARSSYGNFHGGEIMYNEATANGGGIALDGNTLGILDSVTIANNKAATYGGGVYVPPEVAAVDQIWRTKGGVTDHAFKFRGSLQIYDNTAGSKTDNVYLAHGTVSSSYLPGVIGETLGTGYTGAPLIGIGGPLIANGIVARVGVTLGNYSFKSGIFTSGYGQNGNSGVSSYLYFSADNATYSVVDNDNGMGTSNEAKLSTHQDDNGGITWVIEGTGTDADTDTEKGFSTLKIVIDSSGVPTYYYKNPNNTKGLTNLTEVNGTSEMNNEIQLNDGEPTKKLLDILKDKFTVSSGSITFEYSMLKVTKISAYAGSPTFSVSGDDLKPSDPADLVATWECATGMPNDKPTYTVTNTFDVANFRFKLGIEDLTATKSSVSTQMQKAIGATDGSISYAGEYSFLISGARYTNPSFKIRINQVGVAVDRQLYYNGKDVTDLWGTKDWIDWNGDGSHDRGIDPTKPNEDDQPYFIYSGGYYYPVLSADFNNTTTGMLTLQNPDTGTPFTVAKTEFTGYVLDFTYANGYFGVSTKEYSSGVKKGKEVLFGSHSGGGIEYQTMHRKPDSAAGTGTYVPGVMHAGMYQVSFISSRTAASADAANDDYKNTGVYFAANNFAFSSAVYLYVDPAGAEVTLTENAQKNFTYKGLAYTDREVVQFDNTSDTSVNPHTDANAIISYFLFSDLSYIPGIYDNRTGLYYELSELVNWNEIRPTGTGYSGDGTSGPKLTNINDTELQAEPSVTWTDNGNIFSKTAYNKSDGGFDLAKFEKDYQRPRAMDSTGRLCYIIDNDSFAEKKNSEPLNARRYVVLVSLKLDVGYEDYDYDFDQDKEHLVGLEDGSGYFWAFEFTIDPAEVDPYENSVGAGAGSGNTSVSITKEVIYNNEEITAANVAAKLGLTVNYGSTLLTEDIDGVGESKDGAGDYTLELASSKDYTNASVSGANFETPTYLPLIIKFGGSNANYVNAKHSDALGEVVTTQEGLTGNIAHEYSTDDGATGYAFVVYFRIVPVEITVSASLSYTYDGSNFERARFLPARNDGDRHYDAWYESIFFLVQDGITTPNELIENQAKFDNSKSDKGYGYMTQTTYKSWDGDEGKTRGLDDLWGRDNTTRGYDDATYHMRRFTLGNVTVNYSNEEFKQHDISFGIGLYAFKTSSADHGSYHLTTVDADKKTQENMTGTRVTTEPTNVGVTWIITYQPKDGKQVQEFNTSQNFVINTASSLDVTINQKDIGELASDITKVGIDSFKHWSNGGGTKMLGLEGGVVKTGISYPFAGASWKYEPGVTIEYQPSYMNETKKAYGNAMTLNKLAEGTGDYTISYMNNSSASTDTSPARIDLTGRGNYTGTLTLNFTITPAKIAVQYAGVGAVPQYDRTAHGVNVTYANVEDDDAYSKYLDDPAILVGGSGEFKAPQPDASVYSITYKARTRTEGGGFGTAALAKDITDGTVPIDAGVYDVKIVLGSNDYQFVSGKEGESFTPVSEGKYSNTATGSHTILPAVVSYVYANSGEIYNRQAHTPRITFTNITYGKNPTLAVFQNVVPQSDEYTVTIDGKESATDAGNYTVKVELSSHNYCFGLQLVTSGSLIVGYKDGATGKSYPSCEGSTESTYDYTVRSGNSGTTYPTSGSWKAPGDFTIAKATIQLDAFDDSVYNRAAQPQTPAFSNTQSNNEAVPTNEGENAGKPISSPEYEITYIDENVISETNSLNGESKPFYSDLYSVTITLIKAGQKNFQFKTQNITEPHFTHKETAAEALLTQRLGGEHADDASIILAPFLINRVDITVTQLYSSDVYNAKDHFDATGAAGIALENWVSTMFQYTSSEAIKADDLTVDVIFTKTTGDKTSATVHYTPSTSNDTVEYNGKKDYTFTQFAQQGFFTHVATYTVTVQFNEESFYIATSGADNEHLSIPFTYTITPAQISFSLKDASFTYDRQERKPTIANNGITLTNTQNAAVLPTLEAEDPRTEVTVAYSYSGWAGEAPKDGKTVENVSNGFKNAGTYTVKLTLSANGDFKFADGSYEAVRNYTIERRDISSFTEEYHDTDTLKDHAGSSAVGYHYTGSAITPTITLSDGSIFKDDLVLRSGSWEDASGAKFASAFEITFTDNVNAGEAKVTMTGVNNFTGTVNSTFLVLPAIVSVTASDGNGHTETFNPNKPDTSKDNGTLTFSYNKTTQSITFSFGNICNTSALPNSADYIIEYYKAEDWDKDANKPMAGKATLDAAGVTDSGTYYVWIEFTKDKIRTYSNFVFYKEDGTKENIMEMFPTGDPHLFAYGFKIEVTAAEIEIHLPDQFKDAKTGTFTNQFDFNKQDWSTVLNAVTFTNKDGVVPIRSEYTVAFYAPGDRMNTVSQVRDAGTYYLAILLHDGVGNYKVTGVYAGSGTASIDQVLKVNSQDDDGYFANDDRLIDIVVHFTVKKAEIEVYLAEQFKGLDEDENVIFLNAFPYNKTSWWDVLKSVTFANVKADSDESLKVVVPIGSDYVLKLLHSEDGDATATNAGSYTFKFELSGDAAKNYVITAVYAGEGEGALLLNQDGAGNYTIPADKTVTEGESKVGFTAFTVAFTVKPAEIQIHLAEQFRSGSDFVGTFVFNKQSWAYVLNAITLSGENDVVPANSEYEILFTTIDEKDSTWNDAINVGKYRLVFTLADTAAKNYVITAIYAGKDDTFDVRANAGTAYKPLEGTIEGKTLKKFQLAFEVTPAQIDLYLNAFANGDAFKKEFVYDGTDQSDKLGVIELKNDQNIIPSPEGYTVTFLYDLTGRKETDVDVYDVGKYILFFQFTEAAGGNYELRNVYAGPTSSTIKAYCSEQDETHAKVQFELTPSHINVYFSASDLKNEEGFVNEFYYNRNDWARSFGMVTFDTVIADVGTTPKGEQYSIEYYGGTVGSDGAEKWGSTVTEIVNIGRYSVTLRLSNATTGHYPGAKHYNNYTIDKVFVGGTNEKNSVELGQVNAPKKDGYRKSTRAADDVYVTLVFDIKPNVVQLENVSDVVFNDDAQDALFSFSIADGQGAVLPELSRGDFELTYTVDESKKTGNERMKDDKPFFAGAYKVNLKFAEENNFIFEDESHETARTFRVTPVVLSAYLGYQNGDTIEKGNSLTFDGKPHEYQIYTEMTANAVPFITEGDGMNVLRVTDVSYVGWPGSGIELSNNYTNAGTYTLTLTFYIFDEAGKSTKTLGGNFCFGDGVYSITLTYSILQKDIKDATLDGFTAERTYDGQPQTKEITVKVDLDGADGAETTLKLFDNESNIGDYSVTHTPDINVGTVTANIIGMQNYQGQIDVTYEIVPAIVSVNVNEKNSSHYNRNAQGRSFTFENTLKENEKIVPYFNAVAAYSDYTIAYYAADQWDTVNNRLIADAKALEGAPTDAGSYFVLVTLKSSTGVESAAPNFNFAHNGSNADDIENTWARFAFTIEKAEIYVQDIPSAVYTGTNNPAQIVFINYIDKNVLPTSYSVRYTFEGAPYDEEGPTDVMIKDGVPAPYRVLITLTGADAANFEFVAYGSELVDGEPTAGESSGNYEIVEDSHAAMTDYVIVPATVSGSIVIKIDGTQQLNSLENGYTTTPHVPTVSFSNSVIGMSENKPKDGTLSPVTLEKGVYNYKYTTFDGYTITVLYTPSYTDAPFNGMPCDAGTYQITVAFTTNNFRFGDGTATASWTYIVRSREIVTSSQSAGGQIPAENEVQPEKLAAWDRAYDPSSPVRFVLDKLTDFIFMDTAEKINAERATIDYLSCAFTPEEGSSYSGSGYELVSGGGYTLGHAGTYTIRFRVSAPNHNAREFTLTVRIEGVSVEIVVTGTDAEVARYITSIYGSELSSEQITKAFLQLILNGRVKVSNIPGEKDYTEDGEKWKYQVDWLERYSFLLTVADRAGHLSGANMLEKGEYDLTVGVDGYDSGIVFKDNEEKKATTFRPIYTVDPLAVIVDWSRLAEPIYYTGADLTSVAFGRIGILNLFEGDDAHIVSGEGGNKDINGSFGNAQVTDAGDYILCVYGLEGADSANYIFSESAKDTDAKAEYKEAKAYHPFTISRRPVDILLAASQSTYGDQAAIYGTASEKAFRYTFSDTVLEDGTKLHEFIMDLLALWRTDKEGNTTELSKETEPYPYVATDANGLKYWSMLSAASEEAAIEGAPRHFVFDHNYELIFAEGAQGAHTITARNVTIRLNDSSMFYGEDRTAAEGKLTWTASAFDLANKTGFVGEDETAFGNALTLKTDITVTTPHVSDATHAYKVIVDAEQKDLCPDIFASYNITYVEGTFTVMQRPIRIVISTVEVIYGDTEWTKLTGSHWSVSTEIDDTNMGRAGADSTDALKIVLRYSLDNFGNVNVKIDGGEPAPYNGYILGECGNENYAATFVNKDGSYVGGGDVIVKPRTVEIKILPRSGVYGDSGLTYGAQLSAAHEKDWVYADGTDREILERDLAYLGFYLDGTPDSYKDPAQCALYVKTGDRNIVGTWAYGIEDPTPGNNYIIHFYGDGGEKGDCGLFTVDPATVTQENSPSWSVGAAFRSDKDHTDEYKEEYGWYPLSIDATMFSLRGDYDLRGKELKFERVKREGDKVIAIVYTITIEIPALEAETIEIIYHMPTFELANGQTMTDEERAAMRDPYPYEDPETGECLWYVHTVGNWTMNVEIKANDHVIGKFDYTMNIVSVELYVTLDASVGALNMVYSEDVAYAEYSAGWTDFNDRYETEVKNYYLTKKLNEYILGGTTIITSVYGTGYKEAYRDMDYRIFVTDYIKTNCHIEVVSPQISAGGFLNADRYDIQIVAAEGCGFTVQFFESATPNSEEIGFGGRNRLIVSPRVLDIEWVHEESHKQIEEKEIETTGDGFIYQYSGYDFMDVPTFTNILTGTNGSRDLVENPEKEINFRFTENGKWIGELHDVGDYVLELFYGEKNPIKGRDAHNYVLPETVTRSFKIVPLPITVKILDQKTTYGDHLITIEVNRAEGFFEIVKGTASDTKLGHGDDLGDLQLKWTRVGLDGEYEKHDGPGVGVYAIHGESLSKNYAVTFTDKDNNVGDGRYTITARPVDVDIQDKGTGYGVYDNDRLQELVERLYTVHEEMLATWDQIDDLNLKLTKEVGRDVGLYAITGEWDNENYEVTFHGKWGVTNTVEEGDERAEHAGVFTISEREIALEIAEGHSTMYGDPLIDLNDANAWAADVDWYIVSAAKLPAWDRLEDLGIEWTYQDIACAKEYGAGIYENAIVGTDKDRNYAFSVVYGDYEITPRKVKIVIEDASSVYGEELLEDAKFKWHTEPGGPGLAPWDLEDNGAQLDIELHLDRSAMSDRPDADRYYEIVGDANSDYAARNYEIEWKSVDGKEDCGTYTVSPREITVTIDDLSGVYGDPIKPLTFADPSAKLAAWDEVADLNIVLTKQGGVNAGSYYIRGTWDNGNYTIRFVEGTYTITKRPITVQIKDGGSIYGELTAEQIATYLLSTDRFEIAEGSLAEAYGDTKEDLMVVLFKEIGLDAGEYQISGNGSLSPNYKVTVLNGKYTIEQATNEWEREFSLTEFNEGSTPDAERIDPKAKFGERVIKYYLDEACTQEWVGGSLSDLASGTYYAVVTVEGTKNYTGLEDKYTFVVNPMFMVINNNLELWPYIVLWSSQIVALTLAVIFIRRKKQGKGTQASPANSAAEPENSEKQ